MNGVAVTAGSPWGISAISNAEWAGARLVDVLRAAGAGEIKSGRTVQLILLPFPSPFLTFTCCRNCHNYGWSMEGRFVAVELAFVLNTSRLVSPPQFALPCR